jgi:hypothetical protein
MHSARVAALPGEGEDRNGEPAVLLHSPGFYAPFALPTLTHWDAATQSVHLYFLGSFLTEGEDRNGRVFLYRAKLRLARPLSRAVPSGVLPPWRGL